MQIDHGPTLRGADTDGNGIRDDIDKVIQNYNASATATRRLLQYARILQSAIETSSTATDQSVHDTATKLNASVQCIWESVANHGEQETKEVESLSLNTKERSSAYFNNYEKRINGMSFDLESEPCGDGGI